MLLPDPIGRPRDSLGYQQVRGPKAISKKKKKKKCSFDKSSILFWDRNTYVVFEKKQF